jgi:DNA invertase Pin-like site-specific DNA recombinase
MQTGIIGYVRVSTKKQEISGLGLQAQCNAIGDFAAKEGLDVIKIYTETESGRKDSREQLALALAHAKRLKARLVFAKLDRLSRKVSLISQLMDSGVDFTVCDNPHANRFTLHILAAVAEDEAARISARTKAGLAVAKARGTRLGSPKARETVAIARAAKTQYCRQEAQNTAAIIQSIRASGVKTLSMIAQILEIRGVKTPRGGIKWQATQVSRVLAMGA